MPGLYDVSLTVTSPTGSDTFTRNGYIFVDPALAIGERLVEEELLAPGDQSLLELIQSRARESVVVTCLFTH